MKHALPDLSFAPDALEPFLSAETLEYHHGKHHRAYVDKLNALLEGTELADATLTDVVKRSEGALFDNAAQHFNHSFYWRCIAPGETEAPGGALLDAVERDCGAFDDFKRVFVNSAASHFGSGWCWLVKDREGRLRVRTTSDAGCPLTQGETPLLTCDVWEHAYYVDYRNARPAYIDAFWKAIDWRFVELAFERPGDLENEILGQAVSSS